jgi:hypothetical protein
MKVNIQESSVDKTVKGEEKQIKCKGCNKELGILFTTTKPSKPIKRKFVCPCGDSSFVIKSESIVYFVPDEKLDYESFSLEDGTNIAKMKERV